MRLSKAHRFTRVLLGTAILAMGLLVGPFTVHDAGATLGTCGGCPSTAVYTDAQWQQ